MQRKTIGKIAVTLLVFAGMLFTAAAAFAQATTPTDDEVNAVAKKLYCPVCPNTPLDICETQACQDWREQIRAQLAQGWTEDEILDYFVEQYGERVLAEPQRTGFTSLVWLLPVLVSGLGALAAWKILKTWRTGQATASLAPTPFPAQLDSELREEIEEELRALD